MDSFLTQVFIFFQAFFLTAHFSQGDYPYDWYVQPASFVLLCWLLLRLMHWLSKVK